MTMNTTGKKKIIYSKNYEGAAIVCEGEMFDHFLINGKKETLFDVITEAKKLVDIGDYKAAKNMLKEITPLVYQHKDENLHEYLDVVDFYYFENKMMDRKNEFYYHNLFNNRCEKLFPEFRIIKKKNIPGHYPDAWVEREGEEIPVEVKLNDFNDKALRQLKRYIQVYEKSKGIAIGRKLTVKLPENILFISLDELEQN